MTDTIHRFIFDSYGIRGELVKLTDSARRMIDQHQYPDFIANLLKQTAAINVLLATTLKFEGRISIQLQCEGALKLLLVQTTNELKYRGLAQYDEKADFSKMIFADVASSGQLSITIEPVKGERYQGIVPLEGKNIAECIETYFKQSEQLKTKIWLYSDHSEVFGLMLQALPDMISDEAFGHLEILASTLTEQECLSVDSETLLHRLFHQESIDHLRVDTIEFSCGCSRTKMLGSLAFIGSSEIEGILQQDGEIVITCEFCSSRFSFNDLDIKQHQSLDGNATAH